MRNRERTAAERARAGTRRGTTIGGLLAAALAAGPIAGCGQCERLADGGDAEIEVTNDRDETFDVTVRGTRVIYALGTELEAGACALWPVSAASFFVEVSGVERSCRGESASFDVASGETRKVNVSEVSCE